MKRIFYLASVLRKSGSGGNIVEGEKKRTNIGWIIIGAFVCAGLIFCAIKADVLLMVLGDIDGFIRMLFFFAAVMGLFFSLPGILNSLYLSNDLPVLLTFPYRPMEIMAAKVINATGIIWGVSFIFTLPFGITYGIIHRAGPAFYIAEILAFICIPVIVVSVIGSVVMVIMYFAKALRNKDTINIITAVLMFAFLVAMVLIFNGGGENSERLALIVSKMTVVSNIMPINYALGRILTEGALLYIPVVILITAAFSAVFCLLAAKIYLPGALSVQETSSTNGYLSEENLEKACRPKSVFKTYLMKELRHVKREPAYLMQGFLYTIIYPGVMLILVLGASSGNVLKLPDLTDSASIAAWTTCVSLMVSFVCSGTNVISTSCMSREGEGIMILKQTPVDYRIIIRSKLYAAYLICCLGSTTYVIFGGIILVILGYLPVWAIPYGLVINLCTLFFTVSVCMLRDVKKPSFTWESEAQMLKKSNGPSSIVLMLCGIFGSIILAVAIRLTGQYYYCGMIIMIIITALMAFLETRRLYRTGIAKMAKY